MKEEIFSIIESEKDHELFITNGFICEILRHEELLTLNGYIYVEESHPWYLKSYLDISANVHGGLTYTNMVGDMWKLGFDTGHYGDLVPRYLLIKNMPTSHTDVYKDWNYVKNQLDNLSQQAAIVGSPNVKNLDSKFAKMLLSKN